MNEMLGALSKGKIKVVMTIPLVKPLVQLPNQIHESSSLCIGSFLLNLGYFVPSFYIPDMAVSMGIERTKANFLLSIYSE